MVSTGLSELSFGFGFLNEQIFRIRQESLENGMVFTSVPIFPSQQQEASLGYDVYLPKYGLDYYYQFKISKYFYRPWARWRSNALFSEAKYHNGPYFQIYLYKKDNNKQHNRLRILARDKEHTYYVTPQFTDLESYTRAFINGTIIENSRLIPLNQCDDIYNGRQHCITFQLQNEEFIQHSKKKSHKGSIVGKNIILSYKEHQSRWKPINEQFSLKILSDISNVAKEVSTKKEFDEKNEKLNFYWESHEFYKEELAKKNSKMFANFIKTSQLLSIFFGVNLVLVGERDQMTVSDL